MGGSDGDGETLAVRWVRRRCHGFCDRLLAASLGAEPDHASGADECPDVDNGASRAARCHGVVSLVPPGIASVSVFLPPRQQRPLSARALGFVCALRSPALAQPSAPHRRLIPRRLTKKLNKPP